MTRADRPVVVDASAFITLAGVDMTRTLTGLDGQLVVPAAVAEEVTSQPAAGTLDALVNDEVVAIREPPAPSIPDAAAHLDRESLAESTPDGTDGVTGDVALLAMALEADSPVVVSDDKPLRNACKALSVPVSGSIGVLVRAVERGDLAPDRARAALTAMDEVGARLSASLLREAERLIDQAASE